MIIGDEFNKKARKLLNRIAREGEMNADLKVDVEKTCKKAGLDKTEAKNLLEYLESKSLIRIHTYGGPYLYSEIFLTEKGIEKARK